MPADRPGWCDCRRILLAGGIRPQLGTQATKQHVVGDRVAGVPFEARALEPLHLEALAVDRALEWLGDRQAEQRQTLGVALARLAIELQAVAGPVAGEAIARLLIADIMSRLREPHAAGQRPRRYRLGVPIDTLLLKHLLAQQAQQHIIGRSILGVQLEALALEVLHGALPSVSSLLSG